MDAALCAFSADGVITHWNREAERILGWSAEEAVGRRGFAGWAVRPADVAAVEARLLAAMRSTGRTVHEFALVTKEGGRVLVRTQSAGVRGADGRLAGVYCAFSEVHTQIDLERSIALSEALCESAEWGVVLIDADLRPAVANIHAARALRTRRTAMLGRPLGELLSSGVEDLEGALQHVLAEGAPPVPVDLWVTLRGGSAPAAERRRCWRSGFVRLASPLAEEPVPLGVGWFFQDVTEAKLAEQDASRLRFRANQLHRAGLAAAECEDAMEAVTVFTDFAMAGFADHALVDLVADAAGDGEGARAGAGDGAGAGAGDGDTGADAGDVPVRLVRAAATPAGAVGPCTAVAPTGIPVRYRAGHPALQAVERTGTVRVVLGGDQGPERAGPWSRSRQWPEDSVSALCAVLRSRGRTLGVATFLRSAARRPFDRRDAAYAEDVAVRVAASLDLARQRR
jgi:PAS domain S-box-containing protein